MFRRIRLFVGEMALMESLKESIVTRPLQATVPAVHRTMQDDPMASHALQLTEKTESVGSGDMFQRVDRDGDIHAVICYRQLAAVADHFQGLVAPQRHGIQIQCDNHATPITEQ